MAVMIFSTIMVTPVLAGTTVDIGITAIPHISGGIINFIITYVSATQLDLSWGYSGATKAMIRGSYNSYPADVVDEDTAPTEGFLVYYGDGTSTSDTSMNFEENTGTLYYSVYGQKPDGKWYLNKTSGDERSKTVTFLTFVGLFLWLIFANAMLRRASFLPYKIIAALAFVIPFIWVTTVPPLPLVAGSALTNAILILIIGAFLISLFGAFRRNTEVTRDMTGGFSANTEGSRWFWQNGTDVDDERQRRTNGRDRELRLRNYRSKMHRALNPDEENGRRR
jgi:hypothetical protein